MKFKYIWVMLIWVSSANASFIGDLVKNLTTSLNNDIKSAAIALEEDTIQILFGHCQRLKKVLGLEYESDEKPDLSKLTFDFVTPNFTITYNLDNVTQFMNSEWYNKSNGLILFFHGFTDDPDLIVFPLISSAFLQKGIYNILALDASSQIRLFYLRSSTMVQYIGEKVAAALITLIKESELKTSSLYLVGHSLGAHIAGFIGKNLTAELGLKVSRITGLDPAGPCFSDVNSTLRLSNTDADFVDIIHTDAGVFGLNETMGDIDFWPNGGTPNQPNCEPVVCPHLRVCLLYSESILNPEGFPAVACDSYDDFKAGSCNTSDIGYMGLGAKKVSRNVNYYLRTAGSSPFALEKNGTSFK